MNRIVRSLASLFEDDELVVIPDVEEDVFQDMQDVTEASEAEYELVVFY